jgi:hypothetical protein
VKMSGPIEDLLVDFNRAINEEVERRLKAMIPVEWREALLRAEDRIKELHCREDNLRRELAAVLLEVPPCPAHGACCIEYSIEWIRERRQERAKKARPKRKKF